MSEFERVASKAEIEVGGRLSIIVDDTPALLFRIGEAYYAIEDVCTHDGQPLTDGPLDGTEVKCPRHGARFDVTTGAALCMPATEAVTTFAVDVRGDEIFVGPASAAQTTEGSADAATDAVAVSSADGPVDGGQGDSAALAAPGSSGPDDITLIDALKQVIDPELMINIVDLGLVYAVDRNDTNVSVDMTLTSPACPAGPQIVQQAKMALERLDGVDEAAITLTMTPPWSPERMTDEARDQLGIF